MNILGLDYGAAQIGVAISTGSLAEPLTTISTSAAKKSLADLLVKFFIAAIVVGDCPSDFLELLKSFHLPIHQVDETLSSHDARQSLLHTSKSRRKSKEHSVSAALILQSWLDSKF